VPVQAFQRRALLEALTNALGRGKYANSKHGSIPTAIYSESAGQADEVGGRQMSDVTLSSSCDDDVSVRESVGAVDQSSRMAGRDVSRRHRHSVPPTPHGSMLPSARRDASGLSGLELQNGLPSGRHADHLITATADVR